MTRPVRERTRIYSANLAYQTGPAKDRDHLRHLLAAAALAGVAAVVVLGQEAKNLRLRQVVKGIKARLRRGLRVHQDERSDATRGSVILARGLKTRGFSLYLGGDSRATLPRWIARVGVDIQGKRTVLIAAHNFPKRAGEKARDRYLRRLKAIVDRAERQGKEWIVGIDANMPIEWVAEFLGGRAYGHGIDGLIVSDGLDVLDHGVDRYGKRHGQTDHLVPWIEV